MPTYQSWRLTVGSQWPRGQPIIAKQEARFASRPGWSPRRHDELADRGATGGFGLVHVLGDKGRVFEFARDYRADDIGEGEVSGAVFEVEGGDKAVVALLGIGGVGQFRQPGIVCCRAALRYRRRLDLEAGGQEIDDESLRR